MPPKTASPRALEKPATITEEDLGKKVICVAKTLEKFPKPITKEPLEIVGEIADKINAIFTTIRNMPLENKVELQKHIGEISSYGKKAWDALYNILISKERDFKKIQNAVSLALEEWMKISLAKEVSARAKKWQPL